MNKHGGYYGDDYEEIMDFSVNINPLGVPEKLIEVLKEELEKMKRYPEIDGVSGRKVIGQYLGKHSENIILGNGATELLYLFARSLRPEKVLIVEPTFNEYRKAFKVAGSKIYNYYASEEENFRIKVEKLISKIDEINPNVLIICNPNNPTGVFTDRDKLLLILHKLNEINACLFVDESFIDFTDKSSHLPLMERYNMFVLRSMTKIFAVPGLRIGYGIGNRDMISKLNQLKEPWTINSLALKSIPVLLEDSDYLRKTQSWYHEEKQFLYNELKAVPDIKVIESETNFFLIKLLKSDANSLREHLLNRKIYIRSCNDFQGLSDRFIRIAVRKRNENFKLIKELKQYMKG